MPRVRYSNAELKIFCLRSACDRKQFDDLSVSLLVKFVNAQVCAVDWYHLPARQASHISPYDRCVAKYRPAHLVYLLPNTSTILPWGAIERDFTKRCSGNTLIRISPAQQKLLRSDFNSIELIISSFASEAVKCIGRLIKSTLKIIFGLNWCADVLCTF